MSGYYPDNSMYYNTQQGYNRPQYYGGINKVKSVRKNIKNKIIKKK